MSENKTCVIVGGGKSILEGEKTGLWDKIQGQDVWGLNYTYKLYPHKLSRQCFVDFNFFKNNKEQLEELAKQGIPIHSKKHSKLRDITNDYIQQYNSVRETGGFRGREALSPPHEPHLFIGRLGLVGTFAISLAIAEKYNTIYLLGYDFGTLSINDKHTHWYQNKVDVVSTGVGRPTVYFNPTSGLKQEVKDYEVFTNIPDLKIYNVSLDSNIKCFEKISYPEFYRLLEGDVV